ncbi:alcohol dehydrogenase-like [Musca vetustissima]|uniref:alcohol dehydrogenase-like n=1 Tax=Musca vetustissima TaxID=27455 RepID=UPI002AB65EC1|nr:alcohol dehydrogenase-like [Musca vetustissima]
MELKGKNVIYVGGYGGIGKSCVEAFLKKSVKSLLIFDLMSNDEFLKYLQNTYKNSFIDYIHLDLAKSETIKDAFKKAKDLIGSFDIVVNGSGVAVEDQIDLLVQINLAGPMQSSAIAMDYMSKANGGNGGCIVNMSSTANGGNGGCIVNMSSTVGLNPTDFCCFYGATKSGVIHFTTALAQPMYFNKTGVSFITVCPGVTKSPMNMIVEKKSFSIKFRPQDVNMHENVIEQTSDALAENLMTIIENGPNGSIWAVHDGQSFKVELPEIWGPTLRYRTDK